jgi:hypothetical protein
MSTTKLRWKIYTGGEYIAACKRPGDAAALVSIFDEGVVKFRGSGITVTVWHQGKEDFDAEESYDDAAAIMEERVREHCIKRLMKQGMSRALAIAYLKGAR